ncbi:hypothetical protein KS4_32180 [Poriferisphaera corsica]|uniref:Ice-binding protein C-terminal domain-containing protein n=1 Tax=Poriferisphaera corsica TaxID=2528020 RepID=A0A517YY43_9BACT|nr:dockerin type I domain-containing protein [Poriferisphaera corsica]QDU35138.1 hypothetical protein KS4_32180 [Poriferisphaera corsica]
MRKYSTAALLAVIVATPVMAAPTGNYIALLDKQQNHGDSKRSVVFYDTANMSNPMFSVFVGFENGGFEDPGAITIDKATGDVYLAAFDSGAAGGTEIEIDGDVDTTGDIDLFKIDFSSAYNHWANNGMTYRTYHSANFFDGTHPNQTVLGGVVDKIGEVARTDNVTGVNSQGNTSYTDLHLEFVDQNNLLLIDGRNDNTTAEGDHQIRVLNRVNASSGQATVDGQEGGYNNGTSESWQSKQLGLVNMEYDTDAGQVTGGSDIVSSAYINKDGVQGLWILEDDGDGDDVSFFEIGDITGADNSLNKMKGFNVGTGPDYPTGFGLDNDPSVDPTTNDGSGDKLFVDPSTGKLVIVESGYFDDPQHEPKVIVRNVDSYDDAEGLIDFGAWDAPVTIDTSGVSDDDTAIVDGRYSAYDAANNVVYFYDMDNPGAGNGGSYAHDWYALDLNTGQVTIAELDVDVSNGLFGNGDQVEFFSLAAAIAGDFDGNGQLEAADIDMLYAAITGSSTDMQYDVDADNDIDGDDAAFWVQVLKSTEFGDANFDGIIDALDLNVIAVNFNSNTGWANGDFNGDGVVDALDLNAVAVNFGFNAGASLEAVVSAVPEPASLALVGLSGLAMLGRRRRA